MVLLRASFCCIVSMAFFAMPALAQQGPGAGRISAVGKDPSDLYLDAYMSMKEADNLAKKRDFTNAIKKAQQAEKILAGIAADHPDWKSSMVSVRRQNNTNSIQQWRDELRNNPDMKIVSNAAAVVEGGGAPPSITPANTPPSFDELEAKRRQQAAQAAPAPPPSIITPPPPPRIDFPPPAMESQSEYGRLEAQIQKLTYENRLLVQSLKDTRKQLFDARAKKNEASIDVGIYKERYDALNQQLAKERGDTAKLVENLTKGYNRLEKELESAKQQLQLANERNTSADEQLAILQRQLSETEQQLEEVTRDRDSLRSERDNLAALLEFNSPEKTKDLLDRNMTLASKLKEAQDKISRLESDRSGSEDQIAANLKELEKTRAEAAELKTRLKETLSENFDFRRSISELNTKLANAEAELERLSAQPGVDPAVIEENNILRSTIAKQIRTLSTQQQARDLLIAAYKRLNLNNPDIDNAIQLLEDESRLDLTPAEEAAVKSLNLASSSGKDISRTPENSHDSIADAIKEQIKIETLGNVAEDLFEKGRYAAAEDFYTSLIEKQPQHLAARVNLATILLKKDMATEALEHLKRAHEIAPDSAPVCFTMGIASFRKGSDREAMEAFRRVIALQPDNADAYLYMGIVENTAGNTKQAISHFDSALRINPKLAFAHFNKAWALANSGKISQARQSYDLAIGNGALPDPELQRILDPQGSSLPALPAQPAPEQPQIAAAITPVEEQEQHKEVRDAAVIPDEQPSSSKEAPPVQLTSNTATAPQNNPAAPAKNTARPPSPTPKTTAEAPPTPPAKVQKVPAAEEKQELPKAKNRRWFRFN